MSLKPLFIFSLPRSGSTLLQRILAANSSISTVSEPWVLLPFFYAAKTDAIFTDYDQGLAATAIHDLYANFERGEEDYLAEVRAFAMRLYEKASADDARYFLDKTPRYHLIVDDIVRTFPDAKFIFLWRNPLAVTGSIMDTWAGGKWNLHYYKIDLYTGLERLIDSYERVADRVCAVTYEDLILHPTQTLDVIGEYLELPITSDVLEQFSEVTLTGKKGDPTGVRQYQTINAAPLSKWRKTLNNPLRKRWARDYLRWLGKDRLATMGYVLEELEQELAQVETSYKFVASDCMNRAYGFALNTFELKVFAEKVRHFRGFKHVHMHR